MAHDPGARQSWPEGTSRQQVLKRVAETANHQGNEIVLLSLTDIWHVMAAKQPKPGQASPNQLVHVL